MSIGSLISSELSAGATDVLLVIGAVAGMIGILVLFEYVKRAAGLGVRDEYPVNPNIPQNAEEWAVWRDHGDAIAINKSIDRHRR